MCNTQVYADTRTTAGTQVDCALQATHNMLPAAAEKQQQVMGSTLYIQPD